MCHKALHCLHIVGLSLLCQVNYFGLYDFPRPARIPLDRLYTQHSISIYFHFIIIPRPFLSSKALVPLERPGRWWGAERVMVVVG